MAKWLEALAWRLNQPGFDPSYGEILFSHADFVLIERNRSDYIYICVYFGSISSLIQISLNIIDILCLHIFFCGERGSGISVLPARYDDDDEVLLKLW